MSNFNASRLTCFALLSALEADARDLIIQLDEIAGEVKWPSQALSNARDRFVRDNGDVLASRSALVQYLDFPDATQILLGNKPTALQMLNREALETLGTRSEVLISIRNRVAHTRPLQVEDLPTLNDVSSLLARKDGERWPSVVSTLNRLQDDPSFVLGLTVQLRADEDSGPFHNLPVPDFDETGFVGRGNAVRQIKRAVLGPWPAVSILGDGGIGKTSIALKVAYDILDDHKDDFDAIVWVTAKSSTLSSHEVKRINGAILDSVGLLAEAARQLGAPSESADPLDELLDYLATFRVLLILDNMETVMDQRLRDFLRDLPRGSKVLITSRIGFQMESPFKLDPLSESESNQLLMALAHGRNVRIIKELDGVGKAKLLEKTSGHPLYIKWLVASVQAGRRPSEVVSNNETLLDFCMSDVFDKLTGPSRQVLQSMQVMKGARMQAELAFLNAMNAHEIQSALLELLATNFVLMTQSASNQIENGYVVGDFASAYLGRKQPTSKRLRDDVLERAAKLRELSSSMSGDQRLNPLDPWTLDIRGPEDVPVAKILRDAHRAIQGGRPDLALDLCHEAQGLSPSYHEAWRTEALVHIRRRDHGSAEQAFERSIELAEGLAAEAIIKYHFATYLADETRQYDRALPLLQSAAGSNGAIEILLEIARCHFFLMSYAAVIDVCRGAVAKPMTPNQADDLALLGMRAASYGLIRDIYDGAIDKAIELVEQVTGLAHEIKVEQFAGELGDWLLAATHWAERLADQIRSDGYLSKRSDDFVVKLRARLRVVDPELLERRVAHVKPPLPEGGDYLFLADGVDTFVHRDRVRPRSAWARVSPNSVFAYYGEVGDKGPRAVRVTLLD